MLQLTKEKIDAAAVEAAVAGVENGAVVTFAGTVRAEENGVPISAIVYEAYEGMALKELAKIAAAAQGVRIAIAHRLGTVPVGEASVVVCVASPHRPEAFAACREAIDRLKADVPIWKAAFIAPVSLKRGEKK